VRHGFQDGLEHGERDDHVDQVPSVEKRVQVAQGREGKVGKLVEEGLVRQNHAHFPELVAPVEGLRTV